MKLFFCKLSLLIVLLPIVFVSCMFVAYALPINGSNIEKSVQTFEKEGLYPLSFSNKYSNSSFLIRDQYTDCLMLNIAVASKSSATFKDCIENPCYKGQYVLDDMPSNVNKLLSGSLLPDTKYDWYWHGYLTVLKPLLLFFDYASIRWINCAIMFVLFVFMLYLVYKRLGVTTFLSSLTVFLILHCEVIPFTLQYASVFFIAILTTIMLLFNPNFWCKGGNDKLLFFFVGAVTVFVDFLTTPIVSLGIPMIFWILQKNEKYDAKIFDVLKISFFWGLGYGMLWVSKWFVCAATYDPFVLQNAVLHAVKWSGNEAEYGRFYMTIGVLKKIIVLFWTMNLSYVFVIGLISTLLMPLKRRWFQECFWLIIVAFIPLIWSFVLVNHNYVHFTFAWRSFYVTLLAIVLIFSSIVNPKLENNNEKNSSADTML